MFFITLAVLTFVMSLLPLVKAIDLMAKGVGGKIIMSYFVYNMPYLLSFSIPLSSLVSVLLLFGRLSIDGEITAMKASGMNIWQIATPVIFSSVIFSMVCLWLNYDLAPKGHYARRVALIQAGDIDPKDLIVEKEFNNEFPGIQIYIGEINGDEVVDVVFNEMDKRDVTKRIRTIRAPRGTIVTDMEERVMHVKLQNAKIDLPNEKNNLMNQGVFQTWSRDIDLEDMLNSSDTVKKHRKDMSFQELMYALKHLPEVFPKRTPPSQYKQRYKIAVETNKRIALSLSCFSFALIAIPLGMKSRRKESSLGILYSLLIVFFFYLFIVLSESLTGSPRAFPDLIIWIPLILAQILGFVMLKRIL